MSASYTWLTVERIFDDGEGEHIDLLTLLNLRRNGACTAMAPADRAAFYPERGQSAAPAKAACAACPVRAECLTFAIENHERDGVWGGTTEKERRALQRLYRSGMPADQVAAKAVAGDMEDAMAQRRRQGPHVLPSNRKNLPFGWTASGGEIVPDRLEQSVIARMRSLTLAGVTLAEAARRLNADGVRTRLGAHWTSGGIRRALSRPVPDESNLDERQAS